MNRLSTRNRRILEIMLILVVLGMTLLLHQLNAQKMVILNLFFLPIVLSGYYLGRASAGVLALLCAIVVSIVVTFDSTGFLVTQAPIMIGLTVTIWAAVLGLTATTSASIIMKLSRR